MVKFGSEVFGLVKLPAALSEKNTNAGMFVFITNKCGVFTNPGDGGGDVVMRQRQQPIPKPRIKSIPPAAASLLHTADSTDL